MATPPTKRLKKKPAKPVKSAKSSAKPAAKVTAKPAAKPTAKVTAKPTAKSAPSTKTSKTSKPSKATAAPKPVKAVKPVKAQNTSRAAVKAPTAGTPAPAKATPKAAAPRHPRGTRVDLSPGPRVSHVNHKSFTLPEDPPTIDELKKVKSGLSKKDLDHYRQLLLEKRAEMLGDVEAMDRARNDSGGDISHMPLHMADVGSDNYEQEATLGLMEFERKILREIDLALVRINEGYYGVCMMTGLPISRERLDAKPWAKYTIEVVRELEKRGLY